MLLSFSSLFHRGPSLTSPICFCFSPWCSGFISLFRDGETIRYARLELKYLSGFLEKHGGWGVSLCGCVCVGVWTWDSEILKSKRHFTEREKKHDTVSPHIHAESLVMTPSTLCPLMFGCCVNDERLQGLLTSDLPLFTSLMGGEREGENQLFSYKLNNGLNECICR